MAFSFDDLIIFEMANNHQGGLEHGIRIIKEMGKIAHRHNVRAAVKLQYRALDTFIHPDFRDRDDLPHIPRFMSTRLSWEEFQSLVLAIKEHGMVAVVTPFDEDSVVQCINHGVEILKVASCSNQDWPLLEAVAKAGKPVIVSTGGCGLRETDNIVSFMEHRDVTNLAILHCIGKYPTDDADQQLHFMRRLMDRYPNATIGYSGHEHPDNLRLATATVAMGARIQERHVGVPTDTITLNKYSMGPDQVDRWVQELLNARAIVGTVGQDKRPDEGEAASLRSLMRGAYAKVDIKKGQTLDRDKVFFAMPCAEGKTTAKEYQRTLVAERDYKANEAIEERRPYDAVRVLRDVVHEAKGLLREARIPTGSEFQVQLSHHFGMENFRRVGAIIVDFINREYCKKLIILLPGQRHPSHAHKKKEETFQVLFGEMDLVLDGEELHLTSGDMQLVRRGQNHSFATQTGVIFEEISTTHMRDDSYYEDEEIARLDPVKRKTFIDQW